MEKSGVKRGLRVVIVYSALHHGEGDTSQDYVGHRGTVNDDWQGAPDVLLDNGKVVVCHPCEIEPLPITEENTVLDTAMALVRTKAEELAEAEQALLALIREGK